MMELVFVYDIVRTESIESATLFKDLTDVHRAFNYAVRLKKMRMLAELLRLNPSIVPEPRLFGLDDEIDAFLLSKYDVSETLMEATRRNHKLPMKQYKVILRSATKKPPTLIHACIGGPIERIAALHAAGVPIDEPNDKGETPLAVALRKGDGKSAALLVALGASTDGLEGTLLKSCDEIEQLLPPERRGNPSIYIQWLAAGHQPETQRFGRYG